MGKRAKQAIELVASRWKIAQNEQQHEENSEPNHDGTPEAHSRREARTERRESA